MKDKLLPSLRKDVDYFPTTENDQTLIVLSDKKGIAQSPIAISQEMFSVFYILEGNITEQQFRDFFGNEFGAEATNVILQNISQLDEMGFLDSPKYHDILLQYHREYETQPYRPMLTLGHSYPEDKNDFMKYMEDLFQKNISKNTKKNYRGIIAPHLDLSLADYSHRIYAASYNAISESDADTFVIFGTSHFAMTNYFMFTQKRYNTPLVTIENDNEIVNEISKRLNGMEKLDKDFDNFTIDDDAHRWEHSIEYAAVMISYVFRNRKIKIIPILTGSFFEYIHNHQQPAENPLIAKTLQVIKEVISEKNRNVCWISSVDFSHIGNKFGDEFDAKTKLEECEREDKISISHILKANYKEFFQKGIYDQDKWKICGLSPIYSQMLAMDTQQGDLLDYNQWYEEQTKSAVTIAAIGLE